MDNLIVSAHEIMGLTGIWLAAIGVLVVIHHRLRQRQRHQTLLERLPLVLLEDNFQLKLDDILLDYEGHPARWSVFSGSRYTIGYFRLLSAEVFRVVSYNGAWEVEATYDRGRLVELRLPRSDEIVSPRLNQEAAYGLQTFATSVRGRLANRAVE